MREINTSPITDRRKLGLRTALFSAAWGRVLGMVLLASLAMPSYAANNAVTVKPNSVVWGSGNGTAATSGTAAAVTLKPNSVVWGSGNAASPSSTSDSAAAATTKFSADLNDHVGQDGMVTVIVQHRQMPASAHLKEMQGRGAVIRSKFQSIHAVTMHIPASMVEELAKDPNVLYITPDRTQKMTANPAT